MKDLTQGSIPRHILAMAAPMFAGMIVQTLYLLVDLYFVGQIGGAAIAGVASAGNLMFFVMGLTQILGVGTLALIAQAVGRKDFDDASLVFNQSLVLSLACAVVTLVGGYAVAGWYMRTLGADPETTAAGIAFLYAYTPGLALQFALVAMGSALRGTGIVMPTMLVQVVTLLVNTALAPVLIAGWGTGHPLGVAGAGLASSLSVGFGVVLMAFYFVRMEKAVRFDSTQWRPQFATWKRMLAVGLPAGGEFMLMFAFMAVIYLIIRDFGAAAQAGFGVGSRVMQAIFLPAMAIAFATAPIAGQNFGARLPARVRETVVSAVLMGSVSMVLLTVLCQAYPAWFVHWFTKDPDVVAIGADFLQIISWNFVAQGIIFSCSGLFQALGNTRPALLSTASRVVTFVLPALWLSHQPGFRIEHVWYASVASVTLQALISIALARRELRRRFAETPVAVPA
jgi:putative MATE family efflux protein